ncbi:uncharacterized protein LOC118198347 isoform X4 [Stegodyphus dumicola]|uniref:uncharacterized protein LOC118198347 isoform X4 n=1 Tax=Stegodyphus dumicola TaxID=202533 RepID=UPI0015B16815|nr:uncharacterized protein LOC118198347 isoform X4 [Stegodyphus dumicola]
MEGKLIHGVTSTKILQEIRVPEEELKRGNLISRKDLSNIKHKFGISNTLSGCHNENDALSVKSWVEGMKEKADNVVLFYKEQGMKHDHLNENDFLLIIMTPVQKHMLKVFGCGDRICIDSTHGLKNYNFELVTLLVIDEFEEGFPVVFCFTSSVNFETMSFFLKIVHSEVGDINCKIFMSDDAPVFYNAWESVFGAAMCRLLCAWHVDRAWQGHLNSIGNKEKKNKVYKALKSILYELDETRFTVMLMEFLTELEEDSDTKEFYVYFKKYYANRAEMWAYCYRKYARINTNMHVEAFHKILKYIYLEGKKSKRVDNSIKSLICYLEDKNFDRLLKYHKGKMTKKLSVSLKRHKEGMLLSSNCVKLNDNNWKIKSSQSETVYYIKKNSEHNCTGKCVIFCRSCNECVSTFTCSCPDYTIQNNMCKHIHAVLISENKSVGANVLYTGSLANFREIVNESAISVNDNTVEKNNNISVKENKIEILKDKLNSIIINLNNKTDIQPCVYKSVLGHVNAIQNLLRIDEENATLISKDIVSPSEPSNKKIVPQKRFYSVKKQSSKKRLKLAKPSTSESYDFQKVLLGDPVINFGNDHIY